LRTAVNDITPSSNASAIAKIKASQLMGRLEGSFHNPVAIAAEKQLGELSAEVTTVSDSRVTKEIRPITKFRKRTYVEKGGIPLLSSKQIFQIDPVDVKRLAKGAHTKDLPEIQLEENMIAVTRSGTIRRVQIFPAYMAKWTASEDATRILASENINPGYLYTWLASDYGYCLITRQSYGSVIVHIDLDMLASVPIPLPEASIRDEIGNLVLKANQLRHEAWRNEQDAITKVENLITGKQTPQTQIDTVQQPTEFGELTFDPDAPPIWELVAQISAQVPDDEWKKLPTDLARRFDYYQKQKQGQD
jgi:type I restriction enzyme S subunit